MPLAVPHGHDESGLICGFGFSAGAPPRVIESLPQAEALLMSPGDGFVWLHVNLGRAGTEDWIRRHAGLSEYFYEALQDGSRSTRIERDGDTLFGVINDVTFDFGFDARDVATLWIGVSRHLVLSARRRPLRSVDRLRTAVRRGESPRSGPALLVHLLGEQADELQHIVRRSAERMDEIEDAMLAGQHQGHGAELARLRRLMVRLQRLLAPEPSALARTLARPPGWVDTEDLQSRHRANAEFTLVLRDIGALQERVKLMQDEAASRVAEQNNRSLFMLTMVTVLALPINLISGLFGMNVGGIPLAGQGSGFWTVLTLIAALTGALAALAIRRLGPGPR